MHNISTLSNSRCLIVKSKSEKEEQGKKKKLLVLRPNSNVVEVIDTEDHCQDIAMCKAA